MGHLTSGKADFQHLIPLIDRLNQYPVGLVDSPKLREILSLLFSEEEADLAAHFPLHEATIGELEERTGLPRDRLRTLLESMADKGLVMDLPFRGETYYLLMPGVIGFFEFTFMKNRTDLPLDRVARLMSEYFRERPQEGQAREFFGTRTQMTRALVYDDAIPVSTRVVSYHNAREIIEAAGGGAASMCYCRHQREHEGKSC
ncbi:MAG: 4Fe-4S ferredoxin, partial [Candidatus Neomarinimicrobiota bacterium]